MRLNDAVCTQSVPPLNVLNDFGEATCISIFSFGVPTLFSDCNTHVTPLLNSQCYKQAFKRNAIAMNTVQLVYKHRGCLLVVFHFFIGTRSSKQ